MLLGRLPLQVRVDLRKLKAYLGCFPATFAISSVMKPVGKEGDSKRVDLVALVE